MSNNWGAVQTLTVNGNVTTSGQASNPISLTAGSNSITILVTAPGGQTKTYTIHVTRQVAIPY
ncbi:cadherin-like beta sandwich domain-containing protein [Paenibacillus sp. USHLN196]|uniref:cadherin-like beta sandwich domain-containing protein n=1 Tax=Paenibacillus sp. USHLN196 TaxID=3081291 RepID=UPI00301844F3